MTQLNAKPKAEESAPLHVLIIGAGVVGTTLAQALRKYNIPFTVFERDVSATSRGQGWGITIHWALPSLDICLPTHIREKLSDIQVDPEQGKVDQGNFLFINLQTGVVESKVPPNKRLRIKREGLRKLLSEDIPVQWNKKLVNFETTDNGVTAFFEDGTTASGSIIIGAEGSRSRTREIVCPDMYQLQPLPIRSSGLAVQFTPEQAAPLRAYDPLLFQGMHPVTEAFLWFSTIDTPQTNATGGDYYTIQLIISWRPAPGEEAPRNSAERLKKMKQQAAEFAEPFRSAIMAVPEGTEVTDVRLADWPCLEWDNLRGRATLVGDAAHAMTMYRGEAANHGIMDAAKLVDKLVEVHEGKVGLREAVDDYEEEVRARTRPAVLLSRKACIDAHDWKTAMGGESPLLARRAVSLKKDA